jgi:hypothetical protein
LALGRRAADDATLKERLSQYRMDSNASIRTGAAIAYYEAMVNNAEDRTTAIVALREEATAIGPWMDNVRQAAFAGFIALDELATFRELPDYADRKVSLNVFVFDNDRQLATYVAKYWERVTTALGSELLQRLSRYGGNEWWLWDNLAPFISESAAARTDFLAYCARETKTLSSRAVEALAREMPRSHLLREHCLRSLESGPRDSNVSPYDQRRRELVVGRVLGRQFAGDAGVRRELELHSISHPSAAIVGLILSWKDNLVLARELASLRAHENDGRLVWPDAAYLIGAFGSRDEFCSFLSHLVENTSGGIWDLLPFCIEPLVARIRTEGELATHIIARLNRTKSGSEKASFPRLLAMAISYGPGAKRRSQNRTIIPR